MRRDRREFRTVDEVMQAYFARLIPDSADQPQEAEPRQAGEILARTVAESTRAKVQNALKAPNA